MTETEKYEFDRQGFIVLPDFLTQQEVDCLKPAIQKLEKHARKHYQLEPRNARKPNYHFNPEGGYHVTGGHQHGQTLIIEDFFNKTAAAIINTALEISPGKVMFKLLDILY